MKHTIKALAFAASLALTLNACGGGNSSSSNDLPVPTQLTSFNGNAEFQNYLIDCMEPTNPSTSSCVYPIDAEEGISYAPASASPNTAITNNQESGVDEGDIVKNYGSYLITLRRGNLYSAKIQSNHTLSKSGEIAVKAPGLGDAVWYDELLIKGNQLIVIGYRYFLGNEYNYANNGFTEINFFSIQENGQFTRQQTYFLKSSDYYSWKNYSGRQIDNKLVFYMPYYFRNLIDNQQTLHYPKYYRYSGNGQIQELGSLLTAQDIAKPFEDLNYPYLHTIVTCDLGIAPALNCKAKAVIGPYSHQYYVDQNRAYLWVNGEKAIESPDGCGGSYTWTGTTDSAHLYSFDLNTQSAGVVKTQGFPSSQFAFKAKQDALYVLASEREDTSICRLSNADKGLHLLKVSLSEFSSVPTELSSNHYLCLDGNSADQMRFNENHLAYSMDAQLNILELNSSSVTQLDLPSSSVSRIELADSDFLVVSGTDSLNINLVKTAGIPSLGHNYSLEGISEAESRSHAFFYRDNGNFKTFALTTYKSFEDWNTPTTVFWQDESASQIRFFNIQNGNIEEAGVFAPHAQLNASNTCTTSCVDWYGNTRPIFLENEILGLMGNQMVSGFQNSVGAIESIQHLSLQTGEVRNP